jgi:hypothetical protein
MWLSLTLACTQSPVGIVTGGGDPPVADPVDTGTIDELPGEEDTGEEEEEPEEDTADPSDDPVEEALAAEEFYAVGVLQEVRFYLDEDTIRELSQNARRGRAEYLSGSVEINGVRFDNVGVRIKGSSTLRTFDDKPSLKVKFNEFVKGRDFAGLERVTLNNMVEDTTQMKEVLGYRVLREAGGYASRANHAVVYVNDEHYGLYTNLESPDDHWLAYRFEDPSGEFFEANDGADFTRGGVSNWESVSGTGDTTSLDAVTDALREAGDDYYADLDLVVNMTQFFDYWAWNVLVGNIDGYPWNSNDCYVYADPLDGNRLSFVPWGVDESWNAGAINGWSSVSGGLATGCTRNAACKAEFLARMPARLDTYDSFDVAGWHALVAESSAATMEADKRRTFTLSAVQSARTALLEDVNTWSDRMRAALGI